MSGRTRTSETMSAASVARHIFALSISGGISSLTVILKHLFVPMSPAPANLWLEAAYIHTSKKSIPGQRQCGANSAASWRAVIFVLTQGWTWAAMFRLSIPMISSFPGSSTRSQEPNHRRIYQQLQIWSWTL